MPEALDRIYREHRQGLYTLALSIARRPDAAEDAVHEAFTRLCRTGARPANGDLAAYVFAAVRNAAVDQLRRRPRPTVRDVSIFDPPAKRAGGAGGAAPSPEDSAIEAERDRLLRRALDALPGSQREVIVMKLYAGLTFEQIAKALGRPLSTVDSRYRRGLERLRRSVESRI